ncbi:GNAT family N-acetyltransferase [Pseudoalteromonas sp. C2R02]|uniref:GNAT family N-acetyltransferase n=1 Tax=Pseudoalteromonas sp. C2R02 TaxID=2841565 RepID=UPI001C093C9C|nr:GNAT family N-acetyltransferase [Pseudoalteromonas sp. C2R02]MBU2970414.1 GNAT family N-acetyltransferase [Pseudoalteromonas sp. C2R02]
MEVIYKKVPPSDSHFYRALRLESLKHNPEAFETSYQESVNTPELHFEKLIKENNPNKFVMGAYVKNKLVGLCAFVDYNKHDVIDSGTLIQMYVTAKFRGLNISKSLLLAVKSEVMKIKHIHAILLEVKKSNSIAVNTYIKNGFINYGKDADVQDFLMITQLK